MTKAKNKTAETEADPRAYLDGLVDETKRADSSALLEMMERVTGEPPVMWGPSMIGFGRYHYKYDSGREGDFMLTGFAPRKQNLSVYIMPGFDTYEEELGKLGKHKTAKSCLYIRRLDDVDTDVLEAIVSDSVRLMRERYPAQV